MLRVLGAVGLYFNPKKYIFAAKKVTYLGFIVKAGKGITYNLAK